MRIGFDAKRAAQNRTGLGNYSRFVLRILSQCEPANEYHIYIPNPRRTPYLREIPTLHSLHLHFPASKVWRKLRSLWRIWRISNDIRRDSIQIFHGLSNELPLNIRRAKCKSIVTIHDLIFLSHPRFYKPIDRWIYNYKFRRSCKNADHIIAVSEFTKRDIIHYYGIPENKISVVYQGCDPAFGKHISEAKLNEVRSKYSLPKRFVLYVGSIEERKNARLLIEAAEKAEAEGKGFDVVLVGRKTAYTEQLLCEMVDMQCANRCLFLHNVPFEDLPSFYHLATVFVYPSIIEGFGIPLLEAITAGVPAIGCTGSCLEEAGGPSSIYVAPNDADSLERSIINLLEDETERQRMITAGNEYAQRFTDKRLCQSLMEIYNKVYASNT